ncbi:helix-turn-helix domain-containing protein [Flavobacterium sp.]|uniref:helix-turn-helix domain-containing protein n=1 Tax=Flavobacterium sp. TaxID=239 RepID=UPI002FDAACD0
MNSDQFKSFTPKNETLKKYISTIYFHQSEHIQAIEKIVFFPNTHNALTIYKNATCELKSSKPKHIRIKNHSNDNYLFFYGGIQSNYVVSEIYSPFDKIGIVFKPLGINYFFKKPNLGKSVQNNFCFPEIEEEMMPIVDSIYQTDNIEKRLDMLEEFFLNRFNSSFNESDLSKAIEAIEFSNGTLKVGEIAEMLNIAHKTLIRKFKKHLNCTPKQYSKVYKFRRALSNYQKNKKLTNLAIDINYYDQSNFIREFKDLTGIKPSVFFKNIQYLGHDIYWFKF